MIVLVGATGIVGSRIGKRLLAHGARLRVLVRSEAARVRWEARGADAIFGDLRCPASLDPLCRDAGTVISTASAFARHDTLDDVDANGTRSLVRAAEKAGARRFVLVSAFAASQHSELPGLRAKWRGEEAVRESRLDWTILAPHLIADFWVRLLILHSLENGRPVPLVGDGRRRHSFIAADDVSAFAAVSALSEGRARRDVALGGPHALSMRELVSEAGHSLGGELDVHYLPHSTPLPTVAEPLASRAGRVLTALDREDIVVQSAAYGEFHLHPTPIERVFAENLGLLAAA